MGPYIYIYYITRDLHPLENNHFFSITVTPLWLFSHVFWGARVRCCSDDPVHGVMMMKVVVSTFWRFWAAKWCFQLEFENFWYQKRKILKIFAAFLPQILNERHFALFYYSSKNFIWHYLRWIFIHWTRVKPAFRRWQRPTTKETNTKSVEKKQLPWTNPWKVLQKHCDWEVFWLSSLIKEIEIETSSHNKTDCFELAKSGFSGRISRFVVRKTTCNRWGVVYMSYHIVDQQIIVSGTAFYVQHGCFLQLESKNRIATGRGTNIDIKDSDGSSRIPWRFCDNGVFFFAHLLNRSQVAFTSTAAQEGFTS